MVDLLKPLTTAPRVLLEVALKPVAGTRIQPTGFPDLGPATYEAPGENGGTVPTLLVESAQSMANRLEAVCWDEGAENLVRELQGLPFVRVKLVGLSADGSDTTNSLLEFHRLNSPYIMSGQTKDGKPFSGVLTGELGLATKPRRGEATTEGDGADIAGVINLRKLAKVCFRYDPNSLIHGVFLEKIAGRLRHPRALSAFIEATDVRRAESGGVKFDRAMPNPKVVGVDAKTGYGNVPFHRTEFTAKAITAFFSLDLSQLRGYGLPEEATDLLTVLSLWKVRKFLDSTMRLRTACELDIDARAGGVRVKCPDGFTLPSGEELTAHLKKLMGKCKPHFAEPAVTELTWTAPKAK